MPWSERRRQSDRDRAEGGRCGRLRTTRLEDRPSGCSPRARGSAASAADGCRTTLQRVTASLKDKVGTVLQETRILVLTSNVLFGFHLRVHFEERFDELRIASQSLLSGALVAMVVAITLMVAPSQFHRLTDGGEPSRRMHHYTSRLLLLAMVIFFSALLADLFVVSGRLMRPGHAGLMVGVVGALAAIPMFLLPLVQRGRRRQRVDSLKSEGRAREPEDRVKAETRTKISHVLTETRLVLPGAQALLGFQFITFLTRSFEALPEHMQRLHLWSLVSIAVSVTLLVAPAAYHRIVERGEDTEHFYRYASRMVVLATLPLGLGIAADVYLVLWKVSRSPALAGAITAALLLLMAVMWFVIPLVARRTHRHAADSEAEEPPGRRVPA